MPIIRANIPIDFWINRADEIRANDERKQCQNIVLYYGFVNSEMETTVEGLFNPWKKSMIMKGNANILKIIYITIGAYVSKIVVRHKKARINLKFKINTNEELSWKFGVS